MKATLAPKYFKEIGDNCILWFENSNSYIVLSVLSYQFLQIFLKSEDQEAFIDAIRDHETLPLDDMRNYYHEFSALLKEVNYRKESTAHPPITQGIPTVTISKHYSFGDFCITINFSSEQILEHLHPNLAHACIDSNLTLKDVFDIFSHLDFVYLYKNRKFIGAYEKENIHLLQGKFSMELTASLYNNTESDWMATFHASTVCDDKEAIMLIGESGNGKSTLSALLMAHGFDLLSDDFSPMLAKDQKLYRFPAAISIKPNSFPLIEDLFSDFGDLSSHSSSSKNTKVKYLPPLKSFASSRNHFSCRKVVLVKYSSTGTSELTSCSPEKILQTLIPDSWISPKPEHAQLFLHWLGSSSFYELNYSDNTIAVNKFKELFAV